MRRAKGEEDVEEANTSMDVLIDSYIPKSYIKDETQRMEMYRKIAVITDDEDERDVIDELIDRFGDPPKAVLQLTHLSKLRHMASTLQVETIQQKGDDYTFYFVKGYELELSLLNELTSVFGKRLVFSMAGEYSLRLTAEKNALDEVEKVLDLMKVHKLHTRKN